MVVQLQEVLKSLHSTQIWIKVEVEEGAVLVAVHEIKTNNNNKKINPMEKDVVTLEVGRAKEDAVHGEGTNK